MRGRQPLAGLAEGSVTARHERGSAASQSPSVPPSRLHRQEDLAVERPHVVDGDHVRVRELGERLRLAEQAAARAEGRRLRQRIGAEELEGDLAPELGIVRRVDHPHGAGAHHLEHDVAAERRPRPSTRAPPFPLGLARAGPRGVGHEGAAGGARVDVRGQRGALFRQSLALEERGDGVVIEARDHFFRGR